MSKPFLAALLTALLAAMILLPACSDDDPGKPEPFALTVKVVDQAGDPVPGLRLNVTCDNDFMQDHFGKAAVVIPFSVLASVHARLTIEDVTGRTVRILNDEPVSAGWFHYTWDGRDDLGDHLPGGYYEARLVARDVDGDTLRFEGTAPMLMALFDPDVHPVGVTDERGEVVLADKTLFPHLYDVPPFPATDETGEIQGQIELAGDMIFSFADTATSTQMYVVHEVGGPGRLEFLWAPPPPRAPAAVEPAARKRDIDIPDPGWSIGPVFPNPFN